MRIWSLHPQQLDSRGLVAVWREALLAQAVLKGTTKGYRNHPQLDRFRQADYPVSCIATYLRIVFAESKLRGFNFDRSKIEPKDETNMILVTRGQLQYEWQHLLSKLAIRSPELYQRQAKLRPRPHPLFQIREGGIEPWERV